MFYAHVYGYRPRLAEDEIYNTPAEAEARDRAIVIDELSGLAPGVIEGMLAKGLSRRQDEVLRMLAALAAEAPVAESSNVTAFPTAAAE